MVPPTETHVFIQALGVQIVEVPDLDGQCALWDESQQVMEVCANLCPARRARVERDLLGRLTLTD